MTTRSLPPPFPARKPRIAAIGLASWDRLLVVDRYPNAGEYEVVRSELSGPGGTTTNAAVAAAKLGAEVSIRALVGDDPEGRGMRTALDAAGVDTTWLTTADGQPTDGATIIVSGVAAERTIYWHQGARLVRGDRIDIGSLFGHDVVIIDVDDPPLRRFLVDLPAHTVPGARLLGTLTYLEDPGNDDAFDIVMRFDVVTGNARQFQHVAGTGSPTEAIAALRHRMPGENLRAAVITLGSGGAIAVTAERCWQSPAYPVEVVDTTGAGDAFTGALAIAIAGRWEWPVALDFANAVAALSTTRLGAQTALPSWDEVMAIISADDRGEP